MSKHSVFIILLNLWILASSRDLSRISRQVPGGGGFFPPQSQSQEVVEEDYDEDATSPGPGAFGVLSGLFGVFNGIGSLINTGNPNKILESSLNFLPPHERPKAQEQLDKLIGKTTKKPTQAQVIYVTVTVPATPGPTMPAPVKQDNAAVLQKDTNNNSSSRSTQTPNIVVEVQTANPNATTIPPTSTTEDSDEDYRLE